MTFEGTQLQGAVKIMEKLNVSILLYKRNNYCKLQVVTI